MSDTRGATLGGSTGFTLGGPEGATLGSTRDVRDVVSFDVSTERVIDIDATGDD
jgi:hypothetical protein